MSQPIDIDPGPVPDHDAADALPTLEERLVVLSHRAAVAQDEVASSTSYRSTPEGLAELSWATAELGRVMIQLVDVVRQIERRAPR